MRSVAPFVGFVMSVLYAAVSQQPLQWCQVCESWVDDVHRHAEGFGNLLDGDVGHAHQFALFYAPDVLTGQSGTVGEFLLADTLQLAQGSDSLPNALCLLFLIHNNQRSILVS